MEWSDQAALDAVDAVIERSLAAFDPATGAFPNHPLDTEGRQWPPMYMLYLGSAGVLAGLRWLGVDTDAMTAAMWAAYAAVADERPTSGLLCGPLGVMLVADAGGLDVREALLERLRADAHHPANELMWGTPGVMLTAATMARRTGDARFEAVLREAAGALWSGVEVRDGARVWQQDLYGSRPYLVGAAHGLAGNYGALAAVGPWLDPQLAETVLDAAAETLIALAIREEGAVNWPSEIGEAESRVQWCHGAPGVVTSLMPYPVGRSPTLEALLVEAGERIWQAGPHPKGASLCHGTAGNGLALLELYRRTGDGRWLERARAFAMASIDQMAAHRAEHGMGRHSLYTGDVGTALFLQDCVRQTPRGIPGIDDLRAM